MNNQLMEGQLPKRWIQLKKAFESDGWMLDRISGSHHIFTKPKRRCIPVAFHGGTINPRHVAQVLRQAGIFQGDRAADSTTEKEENDVADTRNESPRVISTKEGPVIKQESTRKASQEPKTVSKAELDEASRREKQGQILLDDFRRLELEHFQDNQDSADQRSLMLETIQGNIATGEYGDALASTSFIEQERDFGSSSRDWSFKCNILFYRTVALSEQALYSLSFNSKEQREKLQGALSLVRRLLETSSEHRNERLDFALGLQRRIATRYFDGLGHAFSLYAETSMRQVALDQKSFDNQLDKCADGFEFIASVLEESKIPFSGALANSSMKEIQLVPLVGACVRKMLIAFDKGEYAIASRLSTAIGSYAKRDCINMFAVALSFAPASIHTTPELLLGITSHVKALIPVYKLAQEEMQWSRWAGLMAGVVELRPCSVDFEKTLRFLDRTGKALAGMRNSRRTLVVSNQTRRFIFDTFSDQVMMASITVQNIMLADKRFSRRVMPVMTSFLEQRRLNPGLDVDSLLLSHNCVSELRSSGYDKIRVQAVRLYCELLQVGNFFDELLEIDAYAKQITMSTNAVFLKSRFESFPQALARLALLLKFLFGPENVTLALLTQSVVLNTDLDIAEHFDVKLEDGRTVSQMPLAGGKLSPESVRASGVWSFTIVFNVFGRRFLNRFLLSGERKRLFAIDRVANDPILDTHATLHWDITEPLVFDVISQLSKLRGKVSDSSIETTLLQMVCDPVNSTWCHAFEKEARMKRWAKDKARKLGKLIDRLHQGLGSVDIEIKLEKRCVSAGFMMQKLQESIQKTRKLPPHLKESIECTPTDANMVQACKYLKPWTREEMHQFRIHLLQLEQVSEHFTGYCHTATGGAFPHVKSITSPAWTMGEHTVAINSELSPESRNAITNMMYVRAILEAKASTSPSV